MKKILFYQPDYLNGRLFNPQHKYEILDPFVILRQKLWQRNCLAATIDQFPLIEADRIVFIDEKAVLGRKWYPHDYYQECLKLGMRNKMVLLLLESKSVCPKNHSPSLHLKFDKILTWDDDLVDNRKFFKIYIPYYRHREGIYSVPFSQKKLITSMTQNKVSSAPGELYMARRESIRFFDKNFPNDFDLYGGRWNSPRTFLEKKLPILTEKFVTYKGNPADKLGTISKYKFCLSYENSCGINGYVSEKILDCLWAGTVPIYWGAENIDKYVDPQCFIDRRRFISDGDLARYICGINEVQFNRYIQAARSYLQSNAFKLFSAENFTRVLAKVLDLKFGSNRTLLS